MFLVRAEKLYNNYKSFNSFEEINKKARQKIENKSLKTSFEKACQSTEDFFQKVGNLKELERAYKNPKHKIFLVFRSYLGFSSKWAITGDSKRAMDYQICCEPTIDTFNQWVKGTFLDNYENRNVSEIALNLLLGASFYMRMSYLRNQGTQIDGDTIIFKPIQD
jgi:trans-AT polyketide synthase, acyltransferase and oxidoreductase domains